MLTAQDYKKVAKIHVNSIDQGFLSTLGIPFLSLLYRAIDESNAAILVVEKRDGEIVGFVSGGTTMRPIYKSMLMQLPSLSIAMAPIVFSPKKIRGILEILFHKSNPLGSDLPVWELFSIAVSPEHRGSGAAVRLYDGFKAAVRLNGGESFKIIVGEKLIPAHNFYQKMGAVKISSTAIHGNDRSLIYVQNGLN